MQDRVWVWVFFSKTWEYVEKNLVWGNSWVMWVDTKRCDLISPLLKIKFLMGWGVLSITHTPGSVGWDGVPL